MKAKMLKTATGPKGSFLAGQVYDFGLLGMLEEGKAWIECGSAAQVGEMAVEPAAEIPKPPAPERPRASKADEPPDLPEVDHDEGEREPWPQGRYSPASYLARWPEGPKAELAQLYVDAGKPNG